MSHQRFTTAHLEGREQRIFRGKAQYIGWAVWESRSLGRTPIERVKAADIPLPISLPRTQLSGHDAALKPLDRSQHVGHRAVHEGCQSVTRNRKYSNKVKIRALEFSAFSVTFICLCLPAFHRFFYMWLLWFSNLLYKFMGGKDRHGRMSREGKWYQHLLIPLSCSCQMAMARPCARITALWGVSRDYGWLVKSNTQGWLLG